MASGSFIYVGKSRLRRKYRKQKIENRIKRKEKRRQQREEAQRKLTVNQRNNEKVQVDDNNNNNNDDDNNNNNSNKITAKCTFTEIEQHTCKFCEDVNYRDSGSFTSLESTDSDSEISPLIRTDNCYDAPRISRKISWKDVSDVEQQEDEPHLHEKDQFDDINNNDITDIITKVGGHHVTKPNLQITEKEAKEVSKYRNDNMAECPEKWDEVLLIEDHKVEIEGCEVLISWDVPTSHPKKIGCAPCCVIM